MDGLELGRENQSAAFFSYLSGYGVDGISLATTVDNEEKAVFSSNTIACLDAKSLHGLWKDAFSTRPTTSYSIVGVVQRLFYLVDVNTVDRLAFFGRTVAECRDGTVDGEGQARIRQLVAEHEKRLVEARSLNGDAWLLVFCEEAPSQLIPPRVEKRHHLRTE
jgi:hypothetical protein